MAASAASFTRSQRTFLMLFALNSFASFFIYGLAGPLYPPEATLKGLSPSEFSVIRALAFGTMAILSFFITRMEKLGLKVCFSSGTIIGGSAAITMGLLHYLTSYWLFVTVSIIGFILTGASITVVVASSYLICLTVFPTGTAVGVGVIEGGFLTATCVAPLLCEIIFTYVGYSLTYFIFAAALISTGIIIYLASPQIPPSSTHFPGFKEIVQGYVEIAKFPSVLIFSFTLIPLQMGNDFLAAILEPALRPFELTRIGVGLMFFSFGLPQLLAPFWGILLNKLRRPELFLVASLFVQGTGALVLHRAIELNQGWTTVGLVCYGLGQAMTDLSAIVNFILEVKEKRPQEAASVNYSFIAVIYVFTTGIGGLLGPAIAGVLFDSYGVANAIIFICITHTLMGVVILGHMIRKKCEPRSILVHSYPEYEILRGDDNWPNKRLKTDTK